MQIMVPTRSLFRGSVGLLLSVVACVDEDAAASSDGTSDGTASHNESPLTRTATALASGEESGHTVGVEVSGSSDGSAAGNTDTAYTTGEVSDDLSGGTGMTATGSESLYCSGRCFPSAAAGWTGPVWVGTAETALDCPGEAPHLAMTAGTGLVIPAATCECSCNEAPTLSCGEVREYRWDDVCGDDGPSNFGATYSDVSACNAWPQQLMQTGSPTGVCNSTPQKTELIPSPRFGRIMTACAGVDRGGCGGSNPVCLDVPNPAFPQTCIYREGEHDCPTQFLARFLYYSDFSDTRSCSDCEDSCLATGFECHRAVDVFSPSEDCDGDSSRIDLRSPLGPCEALGSFRLLEPVVTSPGSCTTPQSSLNGVATATQPVTVCCVPVEPLFW